MLCQMHPTRDSQLMSRKLAPLILTALLTITSMAPHASALSAHTLKIPLKFLDSETSNLAELSQGKPIYLKIWATWCSSCLQQMPHFQQVENRYGDDIQLLGINLGLNDTHSRVVRTIAQYQLTMPMLVDTTGALAHALQINGTPFHLLLTPTMKIVHVGNEADALLDSKIAQLVAANSSEFMRPATAPSQTIALPITPDTGQISALYFSATWCESYMLEQMPEAAVECKQSQQTISQLVENSAQLNWIGVMSPLWTSHGDLQDYRAERALQYPLQVDTNSDLQLRFQVGDLSSLVLLDDHGRTLLIEDLNDFQTADQAIKNFQHN